MNLYIIRHGQTDNNVRGRMNGRHDEDINAVGVEQAKEALEKVKKIDYDVIISSPLLRARHTADIVNYKNLPVIYDDRLMERDMGHLTNTPVKHSDMDKHDFWNIKPTRDYGDVEPMKEMYDRIGDFYEEIKAKYKNKTVVVVTHDGVTRTLYAYMNGIPKNGDFLIGSIKNCEVRQIPIQ